MSRFSDAALLKGKYSFHAEQLRAGSQAPSKVDWEQVECDNTAEEAAQEVAKHIFAFNEALDPKTEQMEIMTFSAAGQMKVLALVPGESDLLRIDGVLMPEKVPASVMIHASQLALTFVRVPLDKNADGEHQNEGAKIGFVIFDDLKDRRKSRYKKAATKRAAAKKAAKKKIPSMAELKAKAKKAKAAVKKKAAKKRSVKKA